MTKVYLAAAVFIIMCFFSIYPFSLLDQYVPLLQSERGQLSAHAMARMLFSLCWLGLTLSAVVFGSIYSDLLKIGEAQRIRRLMKAGWIPSPEMLEKLRELEEKTKA